MFDGSAGILVIRTDANREIGYGHLMRCFALGQHWQDAGGQAIFMTASDALACEDRLTAEGMQLLGATKLPGSAEDALEVVAVARQMNASFVVVDGYHFGADFQRIIKQAGLFALVVDDYSHAEHYWADLVLNQNIYAHEDLYKNREPHSRLLLGTRYALLRREFHKWRDWEREIRPLAHKLLITLGGGNSASAAIKVIDALQHLQMEDLEVVVITGMGIPQQDALNRAARGSKIPIRLHGTVLEVPELMAWADVAVSAAGGTSWELAFMGLPSIMVVLSDNQEPVARALASVGVALNMGRLALVDPADMAVALQSLFEDQEARRKMSGELRAIVDGQGGPRVVSAMKSIV
jgi:UDP-2,4-diacetamido-2,4,6-trideoxy-beta-L-altropyranose hydrolase